MELPRGDGGVPMRGEGGDGGKGGERCGVRERGVRLRGTAERGRVGMKREMERREGDRIEERWRAVAGHTHRGMENMSGKWV